MDPSFFPLPLGASKVIQGGVMVAVVAGGLAQSAADASGVRVMGVSTQTVDNTGGAASAKSVEVRMGDFWFKNSGSAPCTTASIGDDIYVEDDTTVAISGTLVAGRCIGFHPVDGRVRVRVGF